MSSFTLVNDFGDPNYGDLDITTNSLSLTSGANAVRQHLQVKFGLFREEWFLDLDVGIPWFQQILGKPAGFVVINDILKSEALDTPGVIGLTRFSFDFVGETRDASLDFTAVTVDGPIDFSKLVDVGGNI